MVATTVMIIILIYIEGSTLQYTTVLVTILAVWVFRSGYSLGAGRVAHSVPIISSHHA